MPISQSCVSSGNSGGVNGNHLQEGLCYTQVCCTQSPCPCGRPLLTCTSTGDTQTQFCLSLCGVSGSWCTQGLFEPSKCFWQVWGLILKVISPLLPSFWGFSFAFGRGVSPQIRSSATQPPLLGRKVMTNLDSILKSRDITLSTKVHLVKAIVFSSSHVWM